jgi:hypothetical protein
MKRFALLVFHALVGALCLLCLTQAASAQCYGWGCDGRPVWENPIYGNQWRWGGYRPYAPPIYHQAYRHPYPYVPVYRPVTRPWYYGGYHYYDHRGYQHGYGGWGGRGGWTTQWRGRWW